MARGDECQTATKANYACKNFDVSAPTKKPASTPSYSTSKPNAKPEKNYGAWGPVFKDKKTFTDMHLC